MPRIISKLSDLAVLFLNTALFLFIILKLRSCNVSSETEWRSLLLSNVKLTSVRLPLPILKYVRKMLIVNSSVFLFDMQGNTLFVLFLFIYLFIYLFFFFFLLNAILDITVHSSSMGAPFMQIRSKQTNLSLCQ